MRVEENNGEIQNHAERVFKDHVMEVLQGDGPIRLYSCKMSSGRFYSFHVASAQGMLTVYGDIGQAVISMNSAYPEDWLCSSISYPQYVIGKIQAGKERVYLQDKIDDFYKTLEPDVAQEIQDLVEDGEDISVSIYRVTGDLETESVLTGWSSDTLWIFEALRCFTRLYTEKTKPPEIQENQTDA